MIQLATDVFAVKEDPEQLDVDETVIEKLHTLHPATLSEYNEGDGPATWILLIPTTTDIMNRFLSREITEQQLLDLTPPGIPYTALYLCSALVLEEYRKRGIAQRLTLDAIAAVRKDNPIEALFVWPFSAGGDALAKKVADLTGLPLLSRSK